MLEKILCILGELATIATALAPIATALTSVATVAVSIAVFRVTRSFNRWQEQLGREQLRHQLYDRRMRVYEIFRELLLQLPLKEADEIFDLYTKAQLAFNEVPFLFNGSAKLEEYLKQLLENLLKKVVPESYGVEILRDQIPSMDNRSDRENFTYKINQLRAAKVEIKNMHLTLLLEEFKPFLTLTDFSEQKNA